MSGEDSVPCDHRVHGCTGTYQVAYAGPKAFMPSELEHATCSCGGQGSASAAACSDGVFAKLLDMGYPAAQARQAAAQNSDVAQAVEWLSADHDAPNSSSSPHLQQECHDIGACSICTEEIVLADAAMRCAGQGGKKHYFHAQCLTSWVRQCQTAGNGVTCPECRGPVQVQARRLEDFLRRKGGQLHVEDREAFQSFRDAAETSDGWSDIRRDLWRAGTAVAIGAGVALVVAAGVHALTKRRRSLVRHRVWPRPRAPLVLAF